MALSSLSWTPKKLEKVPGIHPNISAGIWSPNTCVVNPKQVIQALSKQLIQKGVTLKTGAKIIDIDPEHSAVHLDEERLAICLIRQVCMPIRLLTRMASARSTKSYRLKDCIGT